jgi:signal transduction histidine kinase/DNA-binding response OmpR family regulator
MGDVIRISLLKASGTAGARDLPASTSPDSSDRVNCMVTPQTFRDSNHPALVVDARGHIHDANDAAQLFLDQELESLKSMVVSEVILRLDEVVMDLVFKAAPLGRPVVIEAFCARRDGTMIPCETFVCSIGQNLDGVWQAYLVLVETSPRHENPEAASLAEAKLARAERLEMAGVVAGQIAHDFNNLLTPMLAYPELIRQDIPGNATVGEYLDIIEKTVGDMSRLTQQLLSLARRGRVGTEVFSINEVIGLVVSTMQPVIGEGITVEYDLADNLLSVTGSRDQMRRVLDNLCQNAVDAMGGTGTLRLKTENVYLDTPVGSSSVVKIGEYVKITVSDTGPGIPDEIRDKIFDPFFTTKRASKKRGSGLGLSIVHGIVRDHHGYIDLISTQGQGATFVVYIPISRAGGESAATNGLPRGSERILVVDDDPPQVGLLTQLLEVLGYKATGVSSGEECLRLLRGQKQSFDLIILDMVMERGMDGLVTFMEIRKIVPGQRVILISGYAKAARRIGKAQELGAGLFLRKPLTIERVAKSVREELDKESMPEGGEAAPKRGRRVLIVDDEQMIRKLFGMIIQSEFPDAVIDQAANGDEALVAFRESLPDLVIMDLQMPVRDGRETFSNMEKYCAEAGKSVPPVIFCTGFTPSSAMSSIITDSPVHCLLRKPVKAEALLDAVRNRLRY